MKPFFSGKTHSNSKITLLEGIGIIKNPAAGADEIFNNFFSDAVKDLDIDRGMHVDCMVIADQPGEKSTEMYKTDPGIWRINHEGYFQNNVSFLPISELSTHSVINNIDSSKACQNDNIPAKVLKEKVDICTIVLSSDINNCILNRIFLINLKYADTTPIFKKSD